MSPSRRRAAAIAAALCAFALPAAASAAPEASAVPVAYETVVLQLSNPAADLMSVVSGVNNSGLRAARHGRYMIRVPARDVPRLLLRLASDTRVNYASVERQVRSAAAPDDPCYKNLCGVSTGGGNPSDPNSWVPDPTANQAYLNTVGAPAAWDITKGDGQDVAVLDSGVDQSNPDLVGKIRTVKNDCVEDPLCADPPGAPASDQYGHGTHVSGIIGAKTDNMTGVASLGWNVNVDMFKVLDSKGSGTDADVATGIYDAVDIGDRVINMSLANASCPSVNYDPNRCGPDPDERTAVEYALAHNVVVVAAAGNDGYDAPTFPASYPGVLSVAESDNFNTVQCSSEWGSAANIAAPGLDIPSTWFSKYDYFVETGTSMSAAVVSAAAALMIAHDPSLTSPQITELLRKSANPTSGSAGCGPGNYQPPATHTIYGGALNVPAALAAESSPPRSYDGYDIVGAGGAVYPFGSSIYAGDTAGAILNQPIVGIARTDDGLGYWLVARDGGVFTFGDAAYSGSTGNVRLNEPIVGMAEDPATGGYWLVASDGGVFAFKAPYFGSMGNVRLNQPVVGIAAMPDGAGYWLVAADGGIFTFGNAPYKGSTGNIRLNKPVVGMAATATGQGYWLVASDGGVFTFGDAPYRGSTGGVSLNKPVVSMVAGTTGGGYWLLASDGGVFAFGDARFYGSLGGVALPRTIVGGSN